MGKLYSGKVKKEKENWWTTFSNSNMVKIPMGKYTSYTTIDTKMEDLMATSRHKPNLAVLNIAAHYTKI